MQAIMRPDNPCTISHALRMAAPRLVRAGIDSAPLDARLLLQHALGIRMEALIRESERALTLHEIEVFESLVLRRVSREPVSKILGKKEFYGIDFLVTRDTLDPRPETETVVDIALRLVPPEKKHLRILDLGTGTGCLLITLLLQWLESTGVGIDASTAALSVADANAGRLGVSDRATFQQGSWMENIKEQFDLVVANPPYVKEEDIKTLSPEVAMYDPHSALTGGKDGLQAYRAILPALPVRLKPKAIALLEIGLGQEKDVKEIASAAGLAVEETVHDLAGIPRVLVISR